MSSCSDIGSIFFLTLSLPKQLGAVGPSSSPTRSALIPPHNFVACLKRFAVPR